MKILFYNHTGRVSGAERVLLMILSRLDRERFQSVLLCPADGPLDAMAHDVGVRTVTTQPLQARFTRRPDQLIQYLISLVKMVREARAHIRREAPDVVHANSIRAGLVMSATTVGLRTPVIWHVHDLLPRHPLSSLIRLFAALSPRTRIVAVSQAVAGRFRGRILRAFSRRVPIMTIHNGIELERFDPQPGHRDEVRKSLGVDRDGLLIGTVGQLTPRKGQLELIRAFAEVVEEFSRARLVIVGEAIFNRDDQYRDLLDREARRLGLSDRIQFLGARDDVAALTQAFDLSVVNSSAEPFGLTVVEAMAVKTTVLATAVDGICEILTHDKTGWLVAPRDHDQLVSSLRTLMGNPQLRSALSKRGFAEVHRRFSADLMVNQIETVFYQTSRRKEPATDLIQFATSRT